MPNRGFYMRKCNILIIFMLASYRRRDVLRPSDLARRLKYTVLNAALLLNTCTPIPIHLCRPLCFAPFSICMRLLLFSGLGVYLDTLFLGFMGAVLHSFPLIPSTFIHTFTYASMTRHYVHYIARALRCHCLLDIESD